MTRIRALLLALLVLAPTAALAAALPYDSLISFGDSLSDTGSGPATPPSYGGRFSNGPVWQEQLASSLGIPESQTRDYAIGGAMTGTTGLGGVQTGLLTQVSGFAASPVTLGTNTLYTVWAGGNDGINLLLNPGLDPVAAVNSAALNIGSAIAQLAALGAHDFVVPNLPNGDRFPLSAGGTGQGNLFATFLNASVDAQLASLQSALGITIYRLDTYSLFENVVASPGSYGLSNVTQACKTSSGTCANPDQYLFWDNVHPTTKGHSLIAAAALALVPEPEVAALIALALLGVAVHRVGHWNVNPERVRG